MKKIISVILCLLLLVPSWVSLSDSYAFQADLAAVEKTIQSVLMLEVYDVHREMFATGSGFVAFNNHTLVTNYHVMEGAAFIIAVSDNGDRYDVTKVLAADKELDIAILEFKNPTGMAPLALADNAVLKRGEPVVTIGSPQGIKNTVAYGNISAFVKWGSYTEIQYTAPISHGSSGGVLLNNAGKVIGVVCAFLEGGQNLNYAVDIDFVASMFANATPGTGVLLADYNPSAGISSADHTPAPETSQGAAVSGLSAVQTGANTVTLSWTERAAGAFTYYISYEIDGNSFYTYDSTDSTSYVIDGLVPGKPYTFYVGTRSEERDSAELRQSLAVASYGDYTFRGYTLNSFNIFACDAGADYETADSAVIKEIPLRDTTARERLKDHYVSLSSQLGSSTGISKGNALYVLYTPSGSVYFESYRFEYPADASEDYIRYINIDGFFDDIIEFEGAVSTGQYTLALYYDGLSAAQTVFSVTAGENTEPTAAPTDNATQGLQPPGGITAFTDGAIVQLNWTKVEGALKYNLYRSQSLSGIYAAIGTSAAEYYTDLSVTFGKTYYYRIESVGGSGVSKRSDAVKVVISAQTTLPSPTPAVTTTPQPSAAPDAGPAYPLEIGEDAYVGTAGDPYINPRINNVSSGTVNSFTLSYYCTDADGNYLYFNNTADYYSEYTYSVQIGPNDYIYPGNVSMNLYGSSVRYIYLAIKIINTADGESITVPDPEYFYWELK